MNARVTLQYLVVGTGRSGTVYVAKLLTALGLPCSHEQIFNGGDLQDALRVMERGGQNSACSAYFGLDFAGPPVAESSYMAVPFLEHELLRQCVLIHVVRDPLHVVRSFLNNLLFFRGDRGDHRHAQEQFISAHLSHIDQLADPASRACYYYLRWNQMIEESIGDRRYVLYPIECGPQPLMEFLGLTGDQAAVPDASCNAYHKWPNHMRRACQLPPISDEEIQDCFLWKEVATLAAKYGYSTRVPRCLGAPRRIPRAAQPPGPAHADKPVIYPLEPQMVQENYYRFNVVQYRESFLGAHQDLGPVDLSQLSPEESQRLQSRRQLLVADSLQGIKAKILESQIQTLTHILTSYIGGKLDQPTARSTLWSAP